MAAEIITKEDLDKFGEKLIAEIKLLIRTPTDEPKKWIKSYQVKNLLKISPNTLHKLRLNGTLSYTKIGGILYYKHEDVIKILNGGHC
ncbi:MAG TPA: helix-turn-helix domain-containing protein [Mucilaginibacter sp.]|jgi:hypothetical protein